MNFTIPSIPPSEQTVLIVPGLLRTSHVAALRDAARGRNIVWLIEEKAQLSDAWNAVISHEARVVRFREDGSTVGDTVAELQSLPSGSLLVLCVGGVRAPHAVSCEIPTAQLRAIAALSQHGFPVLSLAIDEPRETCLATEDAGQLPEACACWADVIPAGQASVATIREKLLVAAAHAWAQRGILNDALDIHLLRGLQKFGRSHGVVDGSDNAYLPYEKILAAALAFSRYLRKELSPTQRRVGVVLPPGKAGLIANLAVVFAGKIPVNFNFTAGEESAKSAMRQSGVEISITASAFVNKVAAYPWPPESELLLLEKILPKLKRSMAWWFGLQRILPTGILAKCAGLGQFRGEDEAVLIFTSGSSGEPKGVPLTHRNLLANVCQFSSRLGDCLGENPSLLGCLPLFHSFGSTVTMWFPCIQGINLVTYPNPLESKKIGDLVEKHKVSLLLSTPTFLRGYLKRVEVQAFDSLQMVVTGAEKLQDSFAQAFEERFGKRPLEGYGLTETSPVSNLNTPDRKGAANLPLVAGKSSGSVGLCLPGMAVKITDTNDDSVLLSPDQQGMIWLKGPNVFRGYLDRPELSADVLHDEWFRTGDLGRFTEDGCLKIEGRLSRFSKIGGEMVPHETVEEMILQTMGYEAEDTRCVVVVGVPDEQKGEALVLLSTKVVGSEDDAVAELRARMLEQGVAALWIPKRILAVDAIPVLASGKLDLKGCEMRAREAQS